MSRERKLYLTTAIIIAIVVIIDQTIKIWVKTHMRLGDSIDIFPSFQITFIENDGMAFGWEFGGKYLLTSFRVAMIPLLIWFIHRLIITRQSAGYIACIALILAGNIGNVTDCLFYGLIFTESTWTDISVFISFGDGYTSFMLGRVVDMFHFSFFPAIFNFADAVISCAIVFMFIFARKLNVNFSFR